MPEYLKENWHVETIPDCVYVSNLGVVKSGEVKAILRTESEFKIPHFQNA
jgi:hypothetical protein